MGKSREKMALISQRRRHLTFVDPAAMATELDEKLTIAGVPFEKDMKKSKFVIVEFLNQYKVRYNQTILIILKILSVILTSKNIKILLFFIWILYQ